MEKRFVALEIVVSCEDKSHAEAIANGIVKSQLKGQAIVLRTSRPIKDHEKWTALNTLIACDTVAVTDPRMVPVKPKQK